MMYELLPSGVRCTETTQRMHNALRAHREGLRQPAGPSAADVWAAMALDERRRLAAAALGPACADLGAREWLELQPRERIMIGATARRQAAVLV